MNPAIWQQARDLYERLCDLSVDQQRLELTRSNCHALAIDQAKRMLAAEQTDRLADQLGEHAPQLTERLANVDRSGRQLGPYTITALLARGGMGEIYRAQRTDGAYEQTVAIKFVTLLSDEAKNRFERERQLLAQLEHPNIARLLDGGATEDGTPYLVMEFIDGTPIDQYCDQHRLPIERRLKLFLAVIDAVSAAHRQLIIHRDLKPDNILIDEHTEPHLIDFGIGKSLALDSVNPVMTLADQNLLTPSYAAPEQMTSDAVGTHTDSFQLGLLLDELISGVPVRKLSGLTMQQVVKRCLAPPTPPAQRFEAAADRASIARNRGIDKSLLSQQLSGDLGQVLHKACSIDPTQRYRNVDDFANDIRAVLQHRPIMARPPSRRYLVSKFVRRHRAGVAGTTIALAALIASLLYSVEQAHEARQQRQLAQLENAQQQEVTDFLLSIFRNADPNVTLGREVTARALLEQASEQLNGSASEANSRAAIQHAMGGAYYGLGLVDEAQQHLSAALADYEAAGQVATEDYARAAFLLGEAYQAATDIRALEYHQLALRTRLAQSPRPRAELADSFLATARALRRTNDNENILLHYQKALDTIEAFASQESPAYATALGKVANYHGSTGEVEKAFPIARRAYEVGRRTLAPNEPNLVGLALLLGTVASDTGRFELAKEHLTQAFSGFTQIYGDEHPRTLSTLANLAVLHGNRGELERYLALSTEYRDRLVKVFGPSSPKAAFGWTHLGQSYFRAGRYHDALAAHQQALAIDENSMSESTGGFHYAYIGRALVAVGRPGDAIEHLDTALELGIGFGTSVMTYRYRAQARLALGEIDAAIADANAAVDIARPLNRPQLLAQAETALAEAFLTAGKAGQAASTLVNAKQRLRDSPFHESIALRATIDQHLATVRPTEVD